MSKVYLCKPGGVILGTLTGIDENTASLKQSISDTWELTFEINRYIGDDGDLKESTYYHSVADMMELFIDDIDGEGIYFQIDAEPEISGDGVQERKIITAHSIETELSTKMLHNFKVNCGVKDSQEYLVGKYNADGEFVNLNINPYDGLPIDYIVVYNRYARDLEEFRNKLLVNIDTPSSTWSVDSNTGLIDPDSTLSNGEPLYPALRDLYYQFERLYTDVKEDGTWEAYLNILDNNELGAKYDYKLYVYPGKVEADEQEIEKYRNNISTIISNRYNKALYSTEEAYNAALKAELNEFNQYLQTNVYDKYDKYSYTQKRLIDGLDNLINFYKEYGKQLSLLDLALENAKLSGWQTNIDFVPKDIAYKKFTFNVDNQDILSFFKTNCTKAMKVIFDFDRLNKVIKIIDIQNEGNSNDTGIFLTFRNLINQVNVKTSSTDGIKTKFIPTGNNGLGISYVNFGENNIVDLSWFMDKINEYGEPQYVTKELRNRYFAWLDFRDKPYLENGEVLPSRRDQYIELTKRYNALMKEIDDVLNKMPIDDCEVDFTKYTLDELNTAYTAYMNAYDVIKKSYMADVGAVDFDDKTLVAHDKNGDECTSIKDTFYWHDFICYRDTIIPNVLNALLIYVYTDDGAHDKLRVIDNIQYHYPTPDQPDGYWIGWPGGNPTYNADAKKISENQSEAYLYDMDLYGPTELQAKINAWADAAGIQYREGFILDGNYNVIQTPPPDIYGRLVEYEESLTCSKPHQMYTTIYIKYDSNNPNNTGLYCKANKALATRDTITFTGNNPNATIEYRYNTPDATGWDRLRNGAVGVQDKYSTKEAYYKYLNEYLDYVSPEIRPNGNKVNKQNTEGVIPYAQKKLQELNQQVSLMEAELSSVQESRKEIADAVSLEKYFEQYPLELKTIQTILREASYNNTNILITNLDDIVTTIDKQKELLDDAIIALSEKSQPQLSFEISLDNLYALDEYKPMKDSIGLLKYIRVATGLYDNSFKKLRIISITKNPLVPTEEFQLEFSNMTYSLQGTNDFAHLFDNLDGGSGGSSGGSGSGSGGTYGTNDSEITISNNILSALLRSKSYTNSIGSELLGNLSSNPVFAQQITVSGLFNDLESGSVLIHGDCLVDHIRSKNYVAPDPTQSQSGQGSNLNLKNGTFDLGGGNLVYDDDGNLTIKADYLTIAGKEIPSDVGDAANHAYNHLKWDETNGLRIAQDAQEHSDDGYNTQITSTQINLRHGTTNLTSIKDGEIVVGKTDGYNIDIDGSNNKIKFRNNGTNLLTFDSNGITNNGNFTINSKNYFNSNGSFSLGNGNLSCDTNNNITLKVNSLTIGTTNNIASTLGLKSAAYTESSAYALSTYFKYDTSGVHISASSNYNSGKNILINSEGIYLRNDESSYITLDANGLSIEGANIKTTARESVWSVLEGNQLYFVDNTMDRPLELYAKGTQGYIYGKHVLNLESDINVSIYANDSLSGEIEIYATNITMGELTRAGTINLNSTLVKSTGIYNNTTSKTANVRIATGDEHKYELMRDSSSSKRYKHDIQKIPQKSMNDIHKLYDLPIVQFIYNEDYLNQNDERYQKFIPGFIAEDVDKYYPIACDHNNESEPEDWNFRYVLPPMLALIQEQHKEIEELKLIVNDLKEKIYE